MFSLSEVKEVAISTLDSKDLIPYHLTGSRVLYRQGFNGKNVKVAVVDTGCDYNHPALMTNIIEKDLNFCGYKGGSMDDQGHGCVNGEAKILTSNYGIISIKEFYENMEGDIIQNNNIATVKDISRLNVETTSLIDNEIVTCKIQNVHRLKVKEELIVLNYKNSLIKLTPWHKVYVQTSSSGKKRRISKKRADELTLNDKLILNFNNTYTKNNNKTIYNNILIDEDFMWLIGFILTDGHLNKNPKNKRIEISQAQSNIEAIKKCVQYCEKLKTYNIINKISITETQRVEEYQKTHRIIIYGNQFFDFLVSLGIPIGRRTKDIEVPKFIYSLSNNLIQSFIAGLIDGNGSIEKNGKCRIVFQSRKFVKDLYELCFNIGIMCSYYFNGNGYGKSTFGDCDMYAFGFGNIKSHDSIYNNISINRKKENAKRNDKASKVIAIKSISKEFFDGYLYDLTVEDAHNYIANGVIVSNTHVASTICEIAPACEIVPYKVMAPYGGENEWTTNAIEHIAKRDDIDVVSMSLTSDMKKDSADYIMLLGAIKKLIAKNIFVVVASGNTGEETELYPACFDEVTTVGAVDINKNEALFSTLSKQVDVCQIGVNVVGAKLGGGYVKMSGTSMATPMVAGIAALLIGKYKEQHEGKRPEGRFIHHMLKLSAIDINIHGIDAKTGAGFICLDPSACVMEMKIGSKDLVINGKTTTMDVAPFIKDNRTFVPVRYANSDKFIDWDSTTKTVTIV